MIKELEEEKEESQDPEVEFAIAGAVRECGGLEIILSMIQVLIISLFPLKKKCIVHNRYYHSSQVRFIIKIFMLAVKMVHEFLAQN